MLQTGAGADIRFAGGFAIYDAPEPWGPWTTVYHTDQWDVGPGESCSLPTKWMSGDGRTVHLVFSGDDSFSGNSSRDPHVVASGSKGAWQQTAAPTFRKLTLTDRYYCDGISIGDFNRDGKPDIVAGPFWYEGPDFTHRHEFYPAVEFPTKPAPHRLDTFSYVWDFQRRRLAGYPRPRSRAPSPGFPGNENPKGAAGAVAEAFPAL